MSMVNVNNLGFGGTGVPDTLPQAIAELQGMKMTVVDGAAEDTVMEVEGMDPEDHIGAAINLTDLASIDVDTLTIVALNALATIECLTTAADGDTVVVNGKTYTVRDVEVHPSYNTPPFVVPIEIDASGCDAEDLAERLATAIMSGDSTVTAEVGENADSPPLESLVTVRVREPGTDGNAYTLTETGAAFTVSGATFSGGAADDAAGFTSSATLASKKVLVVWYDKHPGVASEEAQVLMLEAKRPLMAAKARAKLAKANLLLSGPQTVSTAQAKPPAAAAELAKPPDPKTSASKTKNLTIKK